MRHFISAVDNMKNMELCFVIQTKEKRRECCVCVCVCVCGGGWVGVCVYV